MPQEIYQNHRFHKIRTITCLTGRICHKLHNGIKVLMVALMLGAIILMPPANIGVAVSKNSETEQCPDVKIIFARGSGNDVENDKNTLAFFNAVRSKLYADYPTLADVDVKYQFEALHYNAIPDEAESILGALRLKVTNGAAYNFAEIADPMTPNQGFDKLAESLTAGTCAKTRYVLAGFGQGAYLINRSLSQIDPYDHKIIYVALFSDPTIYLPEGEGIYPAVCRGEKLSDYRAYVPDCHAHKGFLGSLEPYVPANLEGKLGTWCNGYDYYCSSKFGYQDHFTYAENGLYDDAAKVIYAKIMEALGRTPAQHSAHDTAILIDSTHSMQPLINGYKSEALRLAKQTLSNGGRIALYDYRDLINDYQPVEHCNFDTCNLALFESELNKIISDRKGNGDLPESLLSASFHVMKALNWSYGSTKSLVVLTDASFLSPDRDGITIDQVVELSKSIDPVNFYIITSDDEVAASYANLASATDGMVVSSVDDAPVLTDFIMDRYDSLPRVVEENETTTSIIPTITATAEELLTNGERLANYDVVNLVILADPTGNDDANIDSNNAASDGASANPINLVNFSSTTPLIPKAPNTGRR